MDGPSDGQELRNMPPVARLTLRSTAIFVFKVFLAPEIVPNCPAGMTSVANSAFVGAASRS